MTKYQLEDMKSQESLVDGLCVCVRTAVGARFCKKEEGGQFPKNFLHLTQSSHALDGHPHFAPPCAGSWHRQVVSYKPSDHKCGWGHSPHLFLLDLVGIVSLGCLRGRVCVFLRSGWLCWVTSLSPLAFTVLVIHVLIISFSGVIALPFYSCAGT